MNIGITVGDQSGIGLEIIEKSIPLFPDVYFNIIGKIIPKQLITYGQVSTVCGRVAGEAIKEVIDLAKKGVIDAIVTAPICKEAFNRGGWNYAGHTEMLADLTNSPDYAMMLIHKNLRVIHVTTHCSLKDAISLVSEQRIFKTIKIADDACKQLGIEAPRIAVAGLNPHCGERGIFGREEATEIIPAINDAKLEGIDVVDFPIPADVVFAKALGGCYDCVVAMYHDQGHIPLKTVGFEWLGSEWEKIDGVNVTFGLPDNTHFTRPRSSVWKSGKRNSRPDQYDFSNKNSN